MKNLARVIGKTTRRRLTIGKEVEWPLPDQLVGIEIEVERTAGAFLPDEVLGWRKTSDGSLRNGVEYVLSQPLAQKELAASIHYMFESARFIRMPTSSTHIHVDMLEEDTPATAMQSIFLLSYMMEDGIFGLADPGREYCGFTNKLTLLPSHTLKYILSPTFEEDGYIFENINGAGRYYGLNLLALNKYGSLEFRYFPTATSADELIDWVKLVQSFKKAAVQLENIAGVQNMMRNEESYQGFINEHFNTWAARMLELVPYKAAKHRLIEALALAVSDYERSGLAAPDGRTYRGVIGAKRFAKLTKKERQSAAETPVQGTPGIDEVPADVPSATPRRNGATRAEPDDVAFMQQMVREGRFRSPIPRLGESFAAYQQRYNTMYSHFVQSTAGNNPINPSRRSAA